MDKKPTLTIGIPAFNEEANIGYLLQDLIDQNSSTYDLHEIVVASDFSTDKTDEIVKSFADKKVKLIANTVREGQAKKQNQIIQDCDSDILVLLNADILIDDKNFINKLIAPIIKGADLTCGPLYEVEPKEYIEKVIALGSVYRRIVFAEYNNGNNIFTCHGSHRAFSKRFYKDFRFSGSVAEDAYSYLECVKKGYKYVYSDSGAYIKLPSTLKDHLNQSTRFFSVANALSEKFDPEFIKNNTKWPIKVFAIEGLKIFLFRPVDAILYALISAYIMIRSKIMRTGRGDIWTVVQSSKAVRG